MDTLAHNIQHNSLNDDDFFDLVRPSSNNDDDVNFDPRNDNYEHFITNSLNSTSEELSYDFDEEDPVQSLPLTILLLTVNIRITIRF